jgi:biopolymer transport protein TolQ
VVVSPSSLAVIVASGEAPGLLELMLTADPIVQLVLLGLIGMSLGCWAIIGLKFTSLRKAAAANKAFDDVFWKSKRLDTLYERSGEFADSPVAAVFIAGFKELERLTAAGSPDTGNNLDRALRRATQQQVTDLEQHIPFLATTGSTAPFIGLFGTVWGILQAFLKLGAPGTSATIQVVGPDIAHALVATAVGLVAAIPAVMAYNAFNAKIRVLVVDMENFSSDFLNLVKRKS